MATHHLDLNKEHLLEHEYLRADIELLRQEVDSISQDMKVLKALRPTLDTILKGMPENN